MIGCVVEFRDIRLVLEQANRFPDERGSFMATENWYIFTVDVEWGGYSLYSSSWKLECVTLLWVQAESQVTSELAEYLSEFVSIPDSLIK